MTPEEEHRERERGGELVRLTDRWGEWYRIWFECGMWWASRDGDKLSGDSPAALESVLIDHMALCRERAPARASGQPRQVIPPATVSIREASPGGG